MFSFSRLAGGDIFIDIKETDFKSIVFYILRNSGFSRKKEAFKAIIAREEIATTAIGNNVAIPHCRLNNFRGFYVKFAIFRQRLGYIAPNKDEIRFMFFIIGPQDDPGYYLRTLSHIAKVMKKPEVRDALLKAKNKRQIKNILCEYENGVLEQKAYSWK